MSEELVLASTSPRRAELLKTAGFSFRICAPQMHEPPPDPGESFHVWIQRLAVAKAQNAHERDPRANATALYLAADTTVFLKETLFGKPRDAEDAFRMLQLLSGKTHQVLTGWALVRFSSTTPEVLHQAVAETKVTWRALDEEEVRRAAKDPSCLDKAGAYGFQDSALGWISRLDGAPSTVIGLPIHDVTPHLMKLGHRRWQSR